MNKCCCPSPPHDSNNINHNPHSSNNSNILKPTNNNNLCLFCPKKYLNIIENKVHELKLNVVTSNKTHNHHHHHKNHRNHNHVSKKHHKSDDNIDDVDDGLNINPKQVVDKNKFNHFVQINVTDTENNLNVCMCALMYESSDNLIANLIQDDENEKSRNIDGSICPRCTNIIKQQPTEHRRTLVSKFSMFANDVIVNRIDTHYLNAYNQNYSKKIDPYTPDSVDSHSPFNEVMEEYEKLNVASDDSEADLNVSKKSCGISPTQLKSKLEKLQEGLIPEEKEPCIEETTNYTNIRRKRNRYVNCGRCCCCMQ